MGKSSYHHKNLKKELIEKGIELVNEHGVAQFSLRKVAQACSVSHAAPYSHFESKEELLDAMQTYITEQFSNALEETILKYQNTSEFLLEFGKTYITFFIKNPQYFTFLFLQTNMQINLTFDHLDKDSYKPFKLYKEQILIFLESSQIPSNKHQDFMIALWAYVHGLASLATMKNVYYDKDWESKITEIIEIFACGFKEE